MFIFYGNSRINSHQTKLLTECVQELLSGILFVSKFILCNVMMTHFIRQIKREIDLLKWIWAEKNVRTQLTEYAAVIHCLRSTYTCNKSMPLKSERGRERIKCATQRAKKPEWNCVHAVNGFVRLYDADNKVP